MSFDDLYNNFKIVEQEVKGTTSSSSSLSSQNMAFVSSPSSTNEVNTAYGVSTANTQVSPASTQVSNCYGISIAEHDDKKVFPKTCEKESLSMEGPRNQDSRNRNQDNSRRTVNVEETSSKAMVAIDGAGFDWSYMADEEVPTNMALMAFSDSEESPDAPLIEELVSDDKLEKKTIFPTVAKIEFVRPKQQEKPVRKPVKYAEMYRLTAITIKGKGWNMVPRAVLMKTGLRTLNTARSNSAVVNAVRANQINAVKASACWVWIPIKLNSASITLKRHNYVDARGRSKSGTCPISQTSRNLMEDMLPLGEEQIERKLLVKELLKLMCDKKNSVLFTDTGCFVLSLDFKLADESQVLLKATLGESVLWHRRLGHVNFRTINKLVNENLVRGLPIKRFENDQTCVACLKRKQHKAFCKSKIQNSITQPLFMLHMDLFGPTFVSSLMNRKYCLVVIDDYSRFTWVFFLATKDETSGILKRFIIEIENQVDKKVKIIRCDNGTEFKNKVMSEFCEQKGIKTEFSVATTPQQNGVAERRNRTLIEAARTMVLVVKPHNKTPDELFRGRTPALSFMRPFGCHVTILNTLDYLGKFDGKSDEGFFVGYSLNSKAFRVYNIRTKKVEESLHIRFLEDKPIIAGTNSNAIVGTEESIGAGHSSKEIGSSQDYILMPLDVEKKDDEGVLTQMLVAKLLVEQDNEMSRELLRKIFMQVMAISVISISSDSSDESVGLSPSQIILFGTIPAEILAETPTIPSVVPTLPHTSPFLYTNSSNSDTSKRPLLHDLYEVNVARWRSRILPAPPRLPYRPPVLVLLGQPIPLGRPYRTQPNGVHYTSSDSSSNSSSDYSLDYSSCHSLPDSSVDAPATISAGPFRKRCRSPIVSVLLATPVPGSLSPVCVDLLLPRKRIRGVVTASDYDDSTKESYEAYMEPDIDSDAQANIDVDIAATKAAAAREAYVGIEVSIGSDGEDEAEEAAESRDRGTIEIGVDRVSDIESA
ncbi:putative ribonuclease H-like domain-containing protein [Tanacetum coccineum]